MTDRRRYMQIPGPGCTLVSKADPVDPALNAAILHLASVTCPKGWHVVEKFTDAPTTLISIKDYAYKHGVFCVASEDSEGTIYDDVEVNIALRAWHDSVHYRHSFAFNTAGEAAACFVQIAQMVHLYGDTERTRQWAEFLLTDLLGLVIYHRQTGMWPKDKRGGVLKNAPKWRELASRLCFEFAKAGKDHETVAVRIAQSEWGYPYEHA